MSKVSTDKTSTVVEVDGRDTTKVVTIDGGVIAALIRAGTACSKEQSVDTANAVVKYFIESAANPATMS